MLSTCGFFLRTIYTAVAFCLAALTYTTTRADDRSDLIKFAMCDIRVLYIYENAERIDWPVLYYLNDNYGCRIDLLHFYLSSELSADHSEIPDREIYSHRYQVPASDTIWPARLAGELFQKRRPDIVIMDKFTEADSGYTLFKEFLLNLPPPGKALFNVQKVYQLLDDGDTVTSPDNGMVIINRQELLHRYRDRIDIDVVKLFPWFRSRDIPTGNLTRYRLLQNNLTRASAEADFLSGLKTFRLADMIDSLFVAGPRRTILKRQASKFISFFNLARISQEEKRIDLLISGYREMGNLNAQDNFSASVDSVKDLQPYIADLYRKAERAALRQVGLNWEGKIIVRDTPHGPRVKFRIAISADSPTELAVKRISFFPFWDTIQVILDDLPRQVAPHQSLVREYPVDIDRAYLESKEPRSLLFTADISYRNNLLTLRSSLPLWLAPELSVKFVPDFWFIPPFARLDIDRVVSSMNVKAIISKPRLFSDTVRLSLETPRGMFAGAYRSEHFLEKGMTRKTVNIPFTISKLFEKGIQSQVISLTVNGRSVAADTGLVRIASCHIADTIKVGFLPDTSGLLEDILRMTDAAIVPLTDRTLSTYNLAAYNVIVIGSGSFRALPTLTGIRDRIENYLRDGGSIVLFSQPADWPAEVLPVIFVPATEYVDRTEISNRIEDARILSKPYRISDKNLFSAFFRKTALRPAVITPAEKIYVTSSGRTLLSISRLGDGQIIYCGLPLLKMISRLDIDAIHLFANILNY